MTDMIHSTVSFDEMSEDGQAFDIRTFPQIFKSERWRMDELHSNDENMIIWVTRGQGRVNLQGTTYGFGPNNAFFLPANTLFSIEITSFIFGSVLTIPNQASNHFPTTPQHLRVRDALQQADFTGLHDRMQHEIDHPGHATLRANTAILELMLVWLERIASPISPPLKSASERLMQGFAALIEDQLYDGLSLAEYAKLLDVTPTHLTRVCQKSCDRSASNLLTERVMYEAKTMLRDSDLAINKISMELAFTSAAYFTRAFQKNTKQTPSEFRNANQNNIRRFV